MSFAARLRTAWSQVRWTAIRSAKAIAAPIGMREIMLFGGAGLIGYGAAMIYPPAAWIAPGVILAGVAILGVRG